MITRHLPAVLKAPVANRGILAEPPFHHLPQLIEGNRRKLDRSDIRIGGLPLPELRSQARRDALTAARDYLGERGEDRSHQANASADAPLLLAGHQPELSHPGVWVKHFALNGMAKQVDGVPLNLVVDNDTLRRPALRLPTLVDRDPASVRLASVPFDRLDGEEPYETRGVHDPELFRSFPDRAAPLWKDWGFEPLLPRVWRDVVVGEARTVGEKFAAARRKWERDWGCRNLELPVSRLCGGEAFVAFARHILGDLPRFRDVYNAALAGYRGRNGLRSANHPAPDLGPAEAPFWTQRANGRRGRATAKSDPASVRPRALTLTLFARVCLGDFFIHGIGGGKYDEVTDEIIRNYFGLEPPAFQVLSATLHLPLPTFPATEADVAHYRRRERDLYWNPQRHLDGPKANQPEVAELLHRHRELAALEPADSPGRRERFAEFRRMSEELGGFVRAETAQAKADRMRAEQELMANETLRRRDLAWVLYPESELRPFLHQFLTPAQAPPGAFNSGSLK